jgi:hypothetical protein
LEDHENDGMLRNKAGTNVGIACTQYFYFFYMEFLVLA